MTIIKTILLLCFVCKSFGNVFISPTFPPTAFQNQFYIVVFRIRGADFPVFRFMGLPRGIVGASNGTLSGIPVVAGSFSVNLSYVVSGRSGWRQFILTVSSDNLRRSGDSVVSVRNSNSLIIVFPEDLVFRTWQRISMRFTARSGEQPYLWSFSNIPTGLIGNTRTGQITGVARQQGYYNINVQVADRVGKSASAFITVNIQPQIKQQNAKILVQVLLQNPQFRLDPEYVKFVQEYAADDLVKAQVDVKLKRDIVNKDIRIVDSATFRFDRANMTYFEAQNQLSLTNLNRKNRELILSDLQKTLDRTGRLLNLSLIQANSSNLRLRESQSSFSAATWRLSDAQRLIDSTQSMIIATNAIYGRAQTALKSATQSRHKLKQDYRRIAIELQLQMQQLEESKRLKQLSDFKITSARDSLILATQASDFTTAERNKMDLGLTEAEKNLALRNQKMTFIRSQHNKARRGFDLDKFDFEVKLNLLYLAQAKKESADRATAFAIAQGSFSDHNPSNQSRTLGSSSQIGTQSISLNSNSGFKGCEQENYPPISGTSQVIRVSTAKKSLTVLSGRTLIYGDCSKVEPVRIGDWIKFQGYILRSVVNVVKVERASF